MYDFYQSLKVTLVLALLNYYFLSKNNPTKISRLLTYNPEYLVYTFKNNVKFQKVKIQNVCPVCLHKKISWFILLIF